MRMYLKLLKAHTNDYLLHSTKHTIVNIQYCPLKNRHHKHALSIRCVLLALCICS